MALDLPTSERGYSANSVKTILDLVRYLNPKAKVRRGKGRPPDQSADEDTDGSLTVTYLRRVKETTERVFGNEHPGSLALHPGIYCYGADGKFISKAFIGAVGFVGELQKKDQFYQFTDFRVAF